MYDVWISILKWNIYKNEQQTGCCSSAIEDEAVGMWRWIKLWEYCGCKRPALAWFRYIGFTYLPTNLLTNYSCQIQLSSIQFDTLLNQGWLAGMRWVFRPHWNCRSVMEGERKWSGKVFQMTTIQFLFIRKPMSTYQHTPRAEPVTKDISCELLQWSPGTTHDKIYISLRTNSCLWHF